MPATNRKPSAINLKEAIINKRTYTEDEAAMYLNISPYTLRQQRSDGNRKNRMPIVPFIKMGRSIRYFLEDLDAYLDRLRSEQHQ